MGSWWLTEVRQCEIQCFGDLVCYNSGFLNVSHLLPPKKKFKMIYYKVSLSCISDRWSYT